MLHLSGGLMCMVICLVGWFVKSSSVEDEFCPWITSEGEPLKIQEQWTAILF